MNKLKFYFAIFFFIFGLAPYLNAQTGTFLKKDSAFVPSYSNSKIYYVTTANGNEFIGLIVDENEREIVIHDRNRSTNVFINKADISTIQLYDENSYKKTKKNKKKEDLGDNVHYGSYIATPNALPFEEGELRGNMHYGIYNSLNYNINKNFAVGLGVVGLAPIDVYLRTSFEVGDRMYVGGDVVFGTWIYGNYNANSKRPIVIGATPKITFGDAQANYSVGGGVGNVFATFNNYGANAAYSSEFGYWFNAALAKCLNDKIAFNAELIAAPQIKTGLLGIGIRTIRREDRTWSFGIFNLMLSNSAFGSGNQTGVFFRPIPYIGYSYVF